MEDRNLRDVVDLLAVVLAEKAELEKLEKELKKELINSGHTTQEGNCSRPTSFRCRDANRWTAKHSAPS